MAHACRIARQRGVQLQEEYEHIARGQCASHERVAQHPQIAHDGVRTRAARARECRELKSVQYTASMPVDVAAEVVANTPLSPLYNVVALAAPEIGAAVAPGQFVMVKAAPGHEP